MKVDEIRAAYEEAVKNQGIGIRVFTSQSIKTLLDRIDELEKREGKASTRFMDEWEKPGFSPEPEKYVASQEMIAPLNPDENAPKNHVLDFAKLPHNTIMISQNADGTWSIWNEDIYTVGRGVTPNEAWGDFAEKASENYVGLLEQKSLGELSSHDHQKIEAFRKILK
jgi:hypothetical protein